MGRESVPGGTKWIAERMGRRRAGQHNSTEHLFFERESLMLRFPAEEVKRQPGMSESRHQVADQAAIPRAFSSSSFS
jgi:hypothetical protein